MRGIGATVFITPAYAPEPAQLGTPAPLSLTGVWKSNDGGTYYLRHIGDIVWWIGLSGGNDGRTYSNIFRVTITTLPVYDNVIDGEWVVYQEGPTQVLERWFWIFRVVQLYTKISDSGGFGPDTWVKAMVRK